MAIPKICKAKKKSGTRCEAYAIAGGEYCLTHSPERARERAERNRKGGRARTAIPKVSGEAVVIATIADVLKAINGALADVWQLENSVPRSRAIGSLAAEARQTLSVGALEDRVAALEATLLERKAGK